MNPGDTVVGEFTMGGNDLRAKLRTLDVFESVLKPYVSVQLTLQDDTDILNRLLSQENVEMSLSFGQPGQRPHSGRYVVTSVEKGRASQSGRAASYDVTAFSRHMTRIPRVQKAYREQTGTDIIRDLVTSFLSPDKAVTVRDPARGVMGNDHMPYNVNGVGIHKAIRAVMERSASASNESSAYVFFENNRNMVVDTLENMLNKKLGSPLFTYYQRPMGQNFLLDQVRQQFNIISLREDSRIDASETIESVNQEMNPFDVFSHDNTRTVLGERGLVTTIVNLVGNAMRPPTHLSKVLPARRRMADSFDAQSLTIQVPLNVEMTVGEAFGVELLAPQGDTSVGVASKVSGSLLATELRHSVNLGQSRMMGTTTMSGTKGGRQ